MRENDSSGHANPTRLTVLKKLVRANGAVAGIRALDRCARCFSRQHPRWGGGELSEEASGILTGWLTEEASPSRADAARLRARLRAFQDTYQRQKWGSVRVIKDRDLLLVDEGLGLYLADPPSPSLGYRLAVTYCQHYDPRYGQDLNGPSRLRLEEICSFIRDHVAQEGGNPLNPLSSKKTL